MHMTHNTASCTSLYTVCKQPIAIMDVRILRIHCNFLYAYIFMKLIIVH